MYNKNMKTIIIFVILSILTLIALLTVDAKSYQSMKEIEPINASSYTGSVFRIKNSI